MRLSGVLVRLSACLTASQGVVVRLSGVEAFQNTIYQGIK